MKKTKKCILFIVLLAIAIFSLNTVMNVLVYNTMINSIVEEYMESNILQLGAVVLFNFLISFEFATIISKIERKSNEKDEEGTETISKKGIIIYAIIYGMAFIATNVLFFLEYIKNMGIVSAKMLGYGTDVYDVYYAHIIPELNILCIILNCIAVIPAVIKLLIMHRKPKNRIKILKPIGNFLVSIFCLLVIAFNIYLYVDIPEFEYVYLINPLYEETSEEIIMVIGYADYMKNITSDKTIPSKILNKDTFFTMGLLEDDIYISGSISWDTVKKIFAETEPQRDKNVILMGSQGDWLVENNQLFNSSKTEMIIRQPIGDSLYIPSTVERLGNARNVCFINKNAIVEEENKIYSSYDGVLYVYNETPYRDTFLSFLYMSEYELMEGADYYKCYVPREKEDIRLREDIEGTVVIFAFDGTNVTIPSTLTNDIDLQGIYIDSFIVEEGNPVYSAIDGNLYNKDATKLINFKSNVSKYDIPNTVQEFSFGTLSALCDSDIQITVDEDNEHFVYEDNILYNKDKTKVIFTKIQNNYVSSEWKQYIEPIDEAMEIDETFKEFCETNGYEIQYKSEEDV